MSFSVAENSKKKKIEEKFFGNFINFYEFGIFHNINNIMKIS